MNNYLIEFFLNIIETYTILLICDFLQFKRLVFKKNVISILFMSALSFLLQLLPMMINDTIICFIITVIAPIFGSCVYYKIAKVYKFKTCIIATFISIVFSMASVLVINSISNNTFFTLVQIEKIVNICYNIAIRVLLIIALLIILKLRGDKDDRKN